MPTPTRFGMFDFERFDPDWQPICEARFEFGFAEAEQQRRIPKFH
jgi:hypothetical protein